MKNLFKSVSVSAIMLFYPLISYAIAPPNDPCSGYTGIGQIIYKLQEILNSVIPFLIALGVVYFVWGVVQYVIADSEEAKTQGKDRIIYGIIGMVVILSLWGLVRIVTNTFELDGESSNAPTKVELDKLLPGRN